MRSGVFALGVGWMLAGSVAGAETEAGAETVSAAETASGAEAGSVLVAAVQGSPEVREAHADDIGQALAVALEARGYAVVADEALGEALVACGTPGCIEQALDGAAASFGVVPAMWLRTANRRELTLTLVGKSGRNLNAGTVIGGDLSETTAALVDQLLARRSGLEFAPPEPADEPTKGPARPHAWKAGPILLWAGGATVFLGIGVAAGMKSDTQRLNTGVVAAWSVIGAAALAGGTAWWVVGQKRRRRQGERAGAALDTAIRVSPRGFDLRLRF